ncbi:hypothetical protein K438DRAFT_1852346, partial [Mycena galopus ATCC 62051]
MGWFRLGLWFGIGFGWRLCWWRGLLDGFDGEGGRRSVGRIFWFTSSHSVVRWSRCCTCFIKHPIYRQLCRTGPL